MRLQEMFQNFGNINSCKVATSGSEDGKSKGHGFVQFESEESASAAIKNLNGTTVGEKQLYIGRCHRRASAGEASMLIARDESRTSRGFGFVNFDNPDDARRAPLEKMNGSVIGSKVLYVARAQKKAEHEQILRHQFEEKRKEQIMKYKGSNVYVKNIDDALTYEELKEHFRQCGTITSAKLMRDEKGINKGFGFVCFSNPEGAIKAVNTFHGERRGEQRFFVLVGG